MTSPHMDCSREVSSLMNLIRNSALDSGSRTSNKNVRCVSFLSRKFPLRTRKKLTSACVDIDVICFDSACSAVFDIQVPPTNDVNRSNARSFHGSMYSNRIFDFVENFGTRATSFPPVANLPSKSEVSSSVAFFTPSTLFDADVMSVDRTRGHVTCGSCKLLWARPLLVDSSTHSYPSKQDNGYQLQLGLATRHPTDPSRETNG